ncbi:MAG: hypothetical protein JW917_04495 [Ignavibacteria bacterium]|nr:hypothetical protein [Ignavibacteria bacterium]
MIKILPALYAFIFLLIFSGCNKSNDNNIAPDKNIDKNKFEFKEIISVNDIPEFNVKGYINGKEVEIVYINFEKWRGNGDNVINFGTKKPEQDCGAVSNDTAFHLMRPSRDFTQGEFIKESFTKDVDGYVADYHVYESQESKKFSVPWNCALVLDEIGEKYVKGKIAMCFKDEKKSWLAGTFEAIRCNN